MKKLFAAVLCFATVSAFSQTADDIIQKYAASMGGLDAFNKISSAKFTGTYTAQGNDFPLTTQIINGKALRTDIDIMGQSVTNCYANGKGWKVNAFAGVPNPTEVSGTELVEFKVQSHLSSALMDYKARGHQVELLGEETVEGIKTWKIKLTSKDDGRVTTYFISQSDNTLIKSATTRDFQGQQMEVETWFSDLKEFGGVKFFMSRDSKIQGQVFQTVKFEKIELDVAIDEKIFEIPK
ncbi:MAG: hypothetical protein HZB42_00130 [Sphingobacteriales bacterium]|nr:hypothetical protein [Sphingobacteriales bacterium]